MESARELLLELISFSRELADSGYAPASGGNASFRAAEGVWVTRGGCLMRSLTERDLVLVDENGRTIRGEGKPSKEVSLHLAVYRRNAAANAVFHFHPPHTIAAGSLVADGEDPIPAMVPTYLMRVRGTELIPYAPPGSMELAEGVERVTGGHQVILLRNHGLVSWGETALQAAQAVEETEQNARIYLLSGGRGTALSREQCDWLKEHYWKRGPGR
jgi:ribulose-5-phosphate 4-epimerase/fuculose-1-phosphate aldolase